MLPRLTSFSEGNKMVHEYTYGNMTASVNEYQNNREEFGIVYVSFFCDVKKEMIRNKKRKVIAVECHLPWTAIKRGDDFMESGGLRLQLQFAMDTLKALR